ncbi:MAG TPA: hypothetical protein VEJ63_17795 [Planctomycetota bacterium]|nr:hypothetical protein [Planctomycetota bacterium]
MAENDSTVASPVAVASAAPAVPARRRWSALWWTLKVLYALAASVITVFWLSFYPAPGHSLETYVPENAGAVLRVRNGIELFAALRDHPSAREILDDEDAEHFFGLQAALEDARAQHGKQRPIVRALYPLSEAGLSPVAGNDIIAARVGALRGKPQLLVLTRLNGTRGAIARFGAWWAQARGRLKKDVQIFDLGGDVLAIGFNGAQPQTTAPAAAKVIPIPQDALLQIRIYPERMATAAAPPDAGLIESPQMRDFAERLPPTVLDALLKPPRAPDILGFPKPPQSLVLHLTVQDNAFRLQGTLIGAVPALPESVRPLPIPVRAEGHAEEPVVHAEGLLPFDPRSAFLAHVENALRIKREAPRLSRTQNRWAQRFEKLYDAGVVLDEDLWPAMGGSLLFSIQQAPLDRSASGYDLLFATIPFKSDDSIARNAAAELVRARWDFLFDGPATIKTTPYVRRVREAESETFILATGKITSPTWHIGGGELLLTSDSGPKAIVDPAGVAASLKSASRDAAIRPDRYFVNINGPKLAATVQQIYTAELDSQEEDIGAAEFLKRVPDAERRIRLAGKLTRLLGDFRAELVPGAKDEPSELRIDWKPGALTAPEETDDVAPPPPAP